MTDRWILAFVLVLAGACGHAQAQPSTSQRPHIEAAASRFGLSAELIANVIDVESNGEVHAMSPAGAMGLMQLMPGTWTMLRARLGLGSDPFDPQDNILAGSAYLRELRDRYGEPGFLAAYNAGPGRYEGSLAGRPLPLETRDYVQRLLALSRVRTSAPPDWRRASLFPAPQAEGLDRPAAEAADGLTVFVRSSPSRTHP